MIRVNETTFDENVILQEMQYHNGKSQRDAMIKASESLIISELLKQRARALGLLSSNEAANADGEVASESVAEKRLSSGKGFSTNKDGSNLESACADDESFSEELFNREVEMPSATEQDCRNYYDNNLDKFCTTPLLAVSHILLAADPEDELSRIEAEDKAKLLIRKLDQDISVFAALAEEHSICPSKKTQGQLGQITKGQTVPEFERQLFSCEAGLVRKPLPSRYGIHVVNVDHRVEGRQMEFSMVQQRIEDYLNEKVRRKAIAQYIETLIAAADIDGFDFSISDSPLIQ